MTRPIEQYMPEIDPVAEPNAARLRAFLIPGAVTIIPEAGQRHNYHIDIDPILNDPAECKRVVRWYVDAIASFRAERTPAKAPNMLAVVEKDKYANDTVGVLRLAAAISIGTSIPHIVVRVGRESLAERIKFKTAHQPELPLSARLQGSNVAIVTDHCTSGSEVLSVVDTVEQSGGTVTSLFAYTIITPEFNQAAFDAKDIKVRLFLDAPHDLLLLGFPLEQR